MGAQASTKKKSEGSKKGEKEDDTARDWNEVMKSGIGVSAKKGSSYIDLRLSGSTQDEQSGIYVACVVQGFKKDQDRFVYIPELLRNPSVFFGGIFDGHGRDGDLVAETVAQRLPKAVRESLLEKLSSKPSEEAIEWIETEVVNECLKKAFQSVQQELDQEFETDVVIPTRKLKEEIEKQQNVDMGELTLPLGSGTTATTVLINAKMLHVAYVGDSRAVLGRKHPTAQGTVLAETLTKDHNIAAGDEDELKRVEASGGTVFGKHVAGDYIEGMLQLTRSLGDVPLHRQNIVLHEPAIKTVPIDSSMLFVIAASDGLWDHFSSEEAVEYVYKHVREGGATGEISEVLIKVAKALGDEAASRAAAKGHGSDDASILLVSLNSFWDVAK